MVFRMSPRCDGDIGTPTRYTPHHKNLREKNMDAAELRATQAPIKEKYKADPKAAFITLRACLEKGDWGGFPICCEYDSHF